MNKTNSFVGAVILAAVALGAVVGHVQPDMAAAGIRAIALFAVLALLAEAMALVLPRSASGSIAFIPYLAMVVLSPSVTTIVAVALVRGVSELYARLTAVKALFNVAAHSVAIAVGILVFWALGGVSLLSAAPTSFADATTTVGLPTVAACVVAMLTNTALVSCVIAINSQASPLAVWRANNLAGVGLDLLASPVVFVFAWIYAAFGAIAAATLWLPILGLRQVHRVNLELERTNEELLQLMVKSLEARDPYTSGHSRRVQQYSMIIARALGLGDREVMRIGSAALLHDVGKIHEKYAPILAKDDRLAPEEWSLMREHPVDGANLVATMTHLRDIVPAIRHHHENWDGTGYPDGIAGELIPLAARIVRFADTIDAMMSERPYRQPLTEAQVRAEIVRCRGTQFDPVIADRLLSSSLWDGLLPPASPEGVQSGLRVVSSLGSFAERRAASKMQA